MHEVILSVLLTASLALIAWCIHSAFRAGQLLARIEDRLHDHEQRLRRLEERDSSVRPVSPPPPPIPGMSS